MFFDIPYPTFIFSSGGKNSNHVTLEFFPPERATILWTGKISQKVNYFAIYCLSFAIYPFARASRLAALSHLSHSILGNIGSYPKYLLPQGL